MAFKDFYSLFLCSICCIATYIYKYKQKHSQHSDDFNERTNTLLYKNMPLRLYSKGLVLVMCERLVGDEDCYILTPSSFDIQNFFHILAGLLNRGSIRTQAISLKLALTRASCPQLTPAASVTWNSNWLTQAVCGTWLYNCLTSTCFLWAYASAPNSTTSTCQRDIPISLTGCTCFALLMLIYTGASLDWRLGRGWICYKYCVLTNIPTYIYEDAPAEIIIVVQNGSGDPSWKPERAVCISRSADTLGKVCIQVYFFQLCLNNGADSDL